MAAREAAGTTPPPVRFRVERGNPDPDELAALAVVLLARCAAAPGEFAGEERRTATWRRPERAPGHRTPRSWRG
nr:SimX2-like protein [uncultured bacterium]